MNPITYLRLDELGSALLTMGKRLVCNFRGPRIGHDYDEHYTCKHCGYFGLNY